MDKEQLLYQSSVNLTKAATEIAKKIDDQSFVIEAITNESQKSLDKFGKNSHAFSLAIETLENDKRSILIMILLVVVILLVCYLRS